MYIYVNISHPPALGGIKLPAVGSAFTGVTPLRLVRGSGSFSTKCFIINNLYIQSTYILWYSFIFPPSPNIMLCYMKIFVISGVAKCVCIYMHIL